MARAGKRSYRELDADEIIRTLDRLRRQVAGHFPGSGLAQVAADLAELGGETERRAREAAAPMWWLRVLLAAVFIVGPIAAGILLWAVLKNAGPVEPAGTVTLTAFSEFAQGMELTLQILVLIGAAGFFAVALEGRLKRRRVIRELNVLRSFAHVIDMHQLAKDPTVEAGGERAPVVSPAERHLDRFALVRYLVHCSELLALTGKLAALYSSPRDAAITGAVNDIEQLVAGLSHKIWQKITILEELDAGAEVQAPA